jgi:methyl-accepting chemotaxis protein
MRAFMNLRLSVKLLLGFAAVLVLTTVLGLFSLAKLAAVRATTVDMAENWLPSVVVLCDMRNEEANMRRGQLRLGLALNAQDKAASKEVIAKAQAAFEKAQTVYEPLITGPEERRLYDSIVAAYKDYRRSDNELAEVEKRGKQAAVVEYIRTAQKERSDKLTAAIQADIEFNNNGAAQADKLSTAIYEGARLWIVSEILCSVVLGIAIALWIARLIGRPVREVCEVAKQVAAGDVTGEEIEVRSTDEVGQLQHSINEMRTSIRDALHGISNNAQHLASSSEELSAVSHQMGANAEETSAQSNVVAAAAEQVSKSVQTVATGAEEMMASIKEIAKNSSEAARVAGQAVKVAENTNTTVGKLGASSAEIGQVIKVITSIAQQTNLLALNATIEAARAGEAGKGFAVVANEVKELAKETAKATEDISSKIDAIQADAQEAVTAIAEISGIIGQINDIQSTIASAVEEQSATTNEIGRNITEAAKGTTEIAQNIGGVAEGAKSTAEGAGNSQTAAAELARMAAELQQVVSRFKTGTQQAPATASLPRQNLRVMGRKAA